MMSKNNVEQSITSDIVQNTDGIWLVRVTGGAQRHLTGENTEIIRNHIITNSERQEQLNPAFIHVIGDDWESDFNIHIPGIQ